MKAVSDDSGMLSVDFLAGFTIFLVALIFVISMIPGLLLNVKSSTVDYDAVSYRTSVILAEDPGWPTGTPWELKDSKHKDEIERLGLSVSSQTPNILSTYKINKFFSSTTEFNFTEDEYRSKAIFGDFGYQFNISLRDGSSSTLCAGEPVPKGGYGYMKRLVKIKHYSSADIQADLLNTTKNIKSSSFPKQIEQKIECRFNYSLLYDKTISAEYRIDPKTEPVTFRIYNLSKSLESESDNYTVNLVNARFLKDGTKISMAYDSFDNSSYIYKINGVPRTMNYNETAIEDKNISDIGFTILPSLMFSSEITSTVSVELNLEYEIKKNSTVKMIGGNFSYDYDSPYMTKPYLTDGVMEVCIW
ncbi:hypothetical protein J2128_001714 [Methanomicrobium sp. W14]|uniref:DUF7287 family protein n=1 Tax=Methanomicrobium sp. W14 TaxID=2817839 RepID=UPI001AE95612|nr:hypothetical protein [Methanomicrobium sp. W14]MBP2133760.1 hypothetical protein [Methanomicrobium sp. W14]